MLAKTLQELEGARKLDPDGDEEVLELMPPATEAEIEGLASALSVPIPIELQEALRVSTGFANGPFASFSLLDVDGFGMDDVFPSPYPVGHDGFGNYWVLDLLQGSPECGPVFFACHDPPVIAFQSRTVSEFAREVVGMWQEGPRSRGDVVHEAVISTIWSSNAGMVDQVGALNSDDSVLSEFAATFPSEAVFADLRSAGLGDGFSWGRYGPRTEWTRAGDHRLWGTVPTERRGLIARLFGRGGG